jgi:hypothetical protein
MNFLQVRGTPGSGKTTLKHLLHNHIIKNDCQASVISLTSWFKDPQQSPFHLTERLLALDPAFPRTDGITFLLLDDGHDSYDDFVLWSIFLKSVHDGIYPQYRVILFCSYGSPTSRPVSYNIGTQLVLRDAALISLWPGERSIGLLLNRPEFDELVLRFKHPLKLHPHLLDLIFDWTTGHAGAVHEMLEQIWYLVS